MNSPTIRFFYDFVDPLSYLVELEIRAAEEATGLQVERVPFELCPPPKPLLDPESPSWIQRSEKASGLASELGVRLDSQRFVPWTRKAHELVLHAGSHSMEAAARQAIFEGVFSEGLDVGRVDVLVGLAEGIGLDPTETKAVLDVDRYSEEVVGARGSAIGVGITRVPSLLTGEKLLEGFHNRHTLGTFLHASRHP